MIYKVISLGPLYSVDTFKGKIHWLIFITFKILLPICFIVTSDSQISTDFDYQAKTIYKDYIHQWCTFHNRTTKITKPFLSNITNWLELFLNLSEISPKLNEQMKFATNLMEIPGREKHRKKLVKIKLKIPHFSSSCCCSYRWKVERSVECLHRREARSIMTSSTIAFLFPFLFTSAVGALLLPLKIWGTDDRWEYVRSALFFIADMTSWLMIISHWMQIEMMTSQCSYLYDNCLPRLYSSHVSYLKMTSFSPWFSSIWGMV